MLVVLLGILVDIWSSLVASSEYFFEIFVLKVSVKSNPPDWYFQIIRLQPIF